MSYSILKRVTWCNHFIDFHFDCTQKDDTAMKLPFALTADAAGRVCRRFVWTWSVWQSLNLLPKSHNDRDGHKIISDTHYHSIHGILSLNDALTLSTFSLSFFLPVFQFFREDSWTIVKNHALLPDVNLRLRVGFGQILPTPAPTPTPAKTVVSDRLHSVVDSTPQPWFKRTQ